MYQATMVLEGGATRGVFTAGVLDCLMEKDCYLSRVIGVSAGSCNALDYVSRQPGRTRDCMIPADKSGNYYYSVRKSFKEKSVMDMDKIFDTYPNQTIPFDYETYFQSEMACEIVATNCLTGKADYLDEREDRKRLMKICRASCSMPLITPVVNVDGIPYLDGGLADPIPLGHALEEGSKKIVVVLTKRAGYRKKIISKGAARICRKAYGSYPQLVHTILTRSFYYNRSMNQVERMEREGKIFVLRPEVRPVSRLEKDPKALRAFYRHGYQMMEQKYEKLINYLEA